MIVFPSDINHMAQPIHSTDEYRICLGEIWHMIVTILLDKKVRASNLIVCYTVGVNLIKQTMIEGFVLTFALMSFV